MLDMSAYIFIPKMERRCIELHCPIPSALDEGLIYNSAHIEFLPRIPTDMDCDDGELYDYRTSALPGEGADAVANLKLKRINQHNPIL